MNKEYKKGAVGAAINEQRTKKMNFLLKKEE